MHCIVTATFYSIPVLLAADSSKERVPLAPLQSRCAGGLVVEQLCWDGGNVFEKQGETHTKCKGQQKLAQEKK